MQIGFSRKISENLLEDIFEIILKNLIEQKKVKIAKFGTFTLRKKNQRIGRNPKTGSPVALSGKYVPHFKPGKELRDRVNSSILQQQIF